MPLNDQTTKREAILTQTFHEGDTIRAQYRWNTGEISQISVPPNFCFDPTAAVRPKSYGRSALASHTNVD